MSQISVHDVADLIRKKLGGKLAPDAVLDENSVLDELGLSSLQTADIIYSIEDRLGTEFDPAEAADVKTVGELVTLANGGSAAAGAPAPAAAGTAGETAGETADSAARR